MRGNNKYEGYCIDLLKLLADRIEGFNFEVYLGEKTGSKLPDGSWDGMMGDLLTGRADVAVASSQSIRSANESSTSPSLS